MNRTKITANRDRLRYFDAVGFLAVVWDGRLDDGILRALSANDISQNGQNNQEQVDGRRFCRE